MLLGPVEPRKPEQPPGWPRRPEELLAAQQQRRKLRKLEQPPAGLHSRQMPGEQPPAEPLMRLQLLLQTGLPKLVMLPLELLPRLQMPVEPPDWPRRLGEPLAAQPRH